MIVNLLHLCLAYIVMNQYSLSSISMFILVLPDHQSPFLLNGFFFKNADTRVMISYIGEQRHNVATVVEKTDTLGISLCNVSTYTIPSSLVLLP